MKPSHALTIITANHVINTFGHSAISPDWNFYARAGPRRLEDGRGGEALNAEDMNRAARAARGGRV